MENEVVGQFKSREDLLHIAICQAVASLNQGDEPRLAHTILRQSLVDYADFAPSPPSESIQERAESVPLCPVHEHLDKAGNLEMVIGGLNCVACSLAEREHLLESLAPFAPKHPTEDSLTVMRRVADFYETHYSEGRIVVSYPAPAPNASPPSSIGEKAAGICAEMARDAATTAAKHASHFRESGNDIDANLKDRYEAKAEALREAERRIALVEFATTTPSLCEWAYNDGDDFWQPSCGGIEHAFQLEAGGPIANKMKFCCYCSRELKEANELMPGDAFQVRVDPWLVACFGEQIARDKEERNHRFLEEALELVQACGCSQSEAHQLVDYTFNRPSGEASQEVGGVMVTLAALCLANGLDMHGAGETELARIWTKVETIRAKQASKPKHSPLPAPSSLPESTTEFTTTDHSKEK